MNKVVIEGKEYEVSKKGNTIISKDEDGKKVTLSFSANGVILNHYKKGKIRMDMKVDSRHHKPPKNLWFKSEHVKSDKHLSSMQKAGYIKFSNFFTTTPESGELLVLVEIN